MSHANAALTPRARLRLARLLVEDGWPPSLAAKMFMVSPITARKWATRYRTEGPAGMIDRSSAPHHQPNRTPAPVVRKIVHLRWKQRLGGALRQGGIAAAGCLHALDHHVERLADDHANARTLARGLGQIDGLTVQQPETNLVYIGTTGALTPAKFQAELRKRVVNEERNWAMARSIGNMERLMAAHGIVMSWPQERNIIRLQAAEPDEPAQYAFQGAPSLRD